MKYFRTFINFLLRLEEEKIKMALHNKRGGSF